MNKSKKPGRYILGDLPPLTDAQRADLAKLATKPDSEIDTEDIPELPSATWAGAVRGQFYKPTKTPITARIDSDVLAWLKTQDGAYQSRMNAILRYVMLHPRIFSEHKMFQVRSEIDDASMKFMYSLLLGAASSRKVHVVFIRDDDAKSLDHGEQVMAKLQREFQLSSLH